MWQTKKEAEIYLLFVFDLKFIEAEAQLGGGKKNAEEEKKTFPSSLNSLAECRMRNGVIEDVIKSFISYSFCLT